MFFFFFSSRRRHTRCLSDWSSDVCSSDLGRGASRKTFGSFRFDTHLHSRIRAGPDGQYRRRGRHRHRPTVGCGRRSQGGVAQYGNQCLPRADSSNTLPCIVWTMRISKFMAVLLAVLGLSTFGHAENPAAAIKKAVERSRLDQPGTKPFHLKAELAPSRARDRGSNRTGEIETWWASPKQWKREVRSPEFHQVAIVSGDQEWQRNEGEYFPECLREVAVALID